MDTSEARQRVACHSGELVVVGRGWPTQIFSTRKVTWDHRIPRGSPPGPSTDELFAQTLLFLNYEGPFSPWIGLHSQDFLSTIGDGHGKMGLLAFILDNGD